MRSRLPSELAGEEPRLATPIRAGRPIRRFFDAAVIAPRQLTACLWARRMTLRWRVQRTIRVRCRMAAHRNAADTLRRILLRRRHAQARWFTSPRSHPAVEAGAGSLFAALWPPM